MSEDPTPFPRPEGEASTINNGGPAFPTGPNKLPGYSSQGMSLRDWFAGMAISGAAGVGYGPVYMAERAYQIADAMLAERGKGK